MIDCYWLRIQSITATLSSRSRRSQIGVIICGVRTWPKLLLISISLALISGCSDPLDLPASEDNLLELRNNAKWELVTGIGEFDLQQVEDAQQGLSEAWATIEGLQAVEANGFSAFCSAAEVGDQELSVPAGKTFAELIEIYWSNFEHISLLRAQKRDACDKYSTYLNSRLVAVETKNPPWENGPTEFVITNNSSKSLSSVYVLWQVRIENRKQALGRGGYWSIVLGGLEPGESINSIPGEKSGQRSWESNYSTKELEEAISLFGKGQLLLRSCFEQANRSIDEPDCLEIEDSFKKSYKRLGLIALELEQIRNDLFDENNS